MDEKRNPRQSPASEQQSEKAAVAMQKVADAMIAATESSRQLFRDQYGPPPETSSPPFLHTRTSSSDSVSSSQGLITKNQAMGASVPMGGPAMIAAGNPVPIPLRLSRRLHARPRSDGIPLLPELPGSTPLGLFRASRHLSKDAATALKLASPILPPRLQTPTTPAGWDAPMLPNFGEARPPAPAAELPSSSATEQVETTDYFCPRDYAYTAIRPDCDPESAPLGSSRPPRVSNEIRRKPVPPPSSPPKSQSSAVAKALVVVVVCVAHALAAAAFAQGMVPASIIGKSFSSDVPGHLAWYSAAYALGAGAFSLPAARVADLFGHKMVFVCGMSWLAAWSLLASLGVYIQDGDSATAYFCFCRAMQGIASALLIPTGHVILRRAYPPGTNDDIVMSFFGASAPLGFVLGAAMAGLFARLTSWAGSFYFLGAVSAVLAVLSFLVIPKESIKISSSSKSIWIRLDAPGIALSILGSVLFSVGWNQVPVMTWDTPYTYFLMIIGAIVLVAFLYLETTAACPLIPVRSLTATAYLVLGLVSAFWGAFGVWIWYLVEFLDRLRGWNVLLSGAALAPLAVSGITASFATSYFLEEKSRARWLMFASAAALFIGSVFTATSPVEQTYWLNTFFSVLIVSLGIVMANPAAVVLLGDNSPADTTQGLPASLTFAVSMYAMSTALGMAGAVEKRAQAIEGDALSGYRGAQYFGLGLAGLGLIVASVLVIMSYVRRSETEQELEGK